MEIEHLVPSNQLKTNKLSELSKGGHNQLFVDYDNEFDALYIRVVPPYEEVVAHYVDEYVALLYLPDSLEIVGLQVENFEYSFLPAHLNVQKVWKLSDSGLQLKDAGDMILAVNRIKPKVAHEVIRATESILGEPGSKLAAVWG